MTRTPPDFDRDDSRPPGDPAAGQTSRTGQTGQTNPSRAATSARPASRSQPPPRPKRIEFPIRPLQVLPFWLAGPFGYLLVVSLLALAPYLFQAGRHWANPIFEPPRFLNRDAPEWIAMADLAPFLSEAAPMRVARPLYPFPAYLIRQSVDPSALTTVGIYRLLNFGWFLLAAALLRWWTLHWTRDPWAALGAGVLFASSSFVQIYLSQPVPEMLTAAASIAVLCLAGRAAGWEPWFWPPRKWTRTEMGRKRREWKPWAMAGILTALLMLGKEIYALYVCLVLIGLWRRAWRPLLAFVAAAAMVHLAYLAWVRWGLGRAYAPYGENQQGFISWIFDDLARLPLAEQARTLARLAGRIALHGAEAFWFWPLAVGAVGFFHLAVRPHPLDCLAWCVGFYLLFLATNIVTPRICYPFFFPMALPAAGAGVVWYLKWVRSTFRRPGRAIGYGILIAEILLGIVVDPYSLFYYG